jgi:hypothetical protein
VSDDLAENLAEAYLQSATSGEEQAEEMLNDFVTEEAGGPFLEEDASPELDLLASPGRNLAFVHQRK